MDIPAPCQRPRQALCSLPRSPDTAWLQRRGNPSSDVEGYPLNFSSQVTSLSDQDWADQIPPDPQLTNMLLYNRDCMVGTCGNTSLGQGGKFASCPANIFRITTTNASAPGHKREDRVRDVSHSPTPLRKRGIDTGQPKAQ